MHLVERGEQLAALNGLFTRSAAGSGAVALIEGAVAEGKTELLRHAARRAERSGSLVLRAACSEAEQALPFGVMDQLLHSAKLPAELAGTAARRLAQAVEAGGREAEISGTAGPAEAIGLGLASALRDLTLLLLSFAERAHVVVAVDDVHLADATSRHCLLYLARRMRPARLALVLTGSFRPGPGRPGPTATGFRSRLLEQPHSESIRVRRLTPEGALSVTRSRLGQLGAGGLAEDVAGASGGNPLLLRALADDVRTAAESGGQMRDEAYVSAVLSLLDREGAPSLLQTARAAAVLGDAAPVPVAALAGLDVDTTRHALRRLEDLGLLRGGTFRHAAAPHGILAALPPGETARLREKAAKMLHETGGPPEHVARLLLSPGVPPQPWAAPLLLESAERYSLAGERETAVAALRLASRASTEERQRASADAALASALWQTAPLASARYAEQLTAAFRRGHLGGTEANSLLHRLLWHGREEAAGEVLTRLRDHAESDPAGTAEVAETERWIDWTYPGMRPRRRPEDPADGRDAAAETRLRPAFRLYDALVTGRAGEAVPCAERLLGERFPLAADTVTATASAQAALTVLMVTGRASTAAGWCDSKLDGPPPPPTWRALLHAVRGEAALRLGDLQAAEDHARQGLDCLDRASWGVAVGLPLSVAVLAAVRGGRHEAAADLLSLPVPAQVFSSRYGLLLRHARGHHYLATHRPRSALDDFEWCAASLHEWNLDVPGTVPWRSGAAEARRRLGDDEAAAALAARQHLPTETYPGERGGALRLAAAAAPPGRRLRLLHEALALVEAAGDQYETIRVLTDLGAALHSLGEDERARLRLRRARRLAASHGVTAVPGEPPPRGRWELRTGAVPFETPSASFLTESEARVAALAVQGLTNREIAGRLYVSASTVEQHLTRVYRKLGVRSRKALPASLARLPRSGSACVLAT